MSDAELLALAEREVGFLTDDNNHCAAAIMRGLIAMLRYRMRESRVKAMDAETSAAVSGNYNHG